MKTVEEFKQAIEQLSPKQQAELLDWLHSLVANRPQLEPSLFAEWNSVHDELAYRDL